MQHKPKRSARLLCLALSAVLACAALPVSSSASAPAGRWQTEIAALSDESDAQKLQAAQAAAQSALAGLTATNATTDEEILSAISASLPDAGVSAAWGDFSKNLATTSASGSITGSIVLTCGTQSATVPVHLTIAQIVYYTITFDANRGKVSPSSATTNAKGQLPDLPVPTRTDYHFEGWFLSESGGKQVFNNHVYTESVTIYAQWTYTGKGGVITNPSTDGTTKPPAEKPTAPVTGSASVTATVNSSGHVFANISSSAISSAAKSAASSAASSGVTAGDISLTISVSSPAKDPDKVTLNLPRAVQEQLISGKISKVTLSVNQPAVSFGLSLAAVTELNKQAKADVYLSVTRVSADTLPSGVKSAFGSRPVFDLKATYSVSEKNISDLGAASIDFSIPYSPMENESAEGLYAAYVGRNGEPVSVPDSRLAAGALQLTTNRFAVYGIGYNAMLTFADMNGHWATADVQFIIDRGLMNGTTATAFSPDEAMTRGMFVTVLGRLVGYDTSSHESGQFTDVNPDAYYSPYVNWAAEKGIVNGTEQNTFSPEAAISRQEMAVMMSRFAGAFGYPVPALREKVTFADQAAIAAYAVQPVEQMQCAGVLNGTDNNRFDPEGVATRGEIASMLHRFILNVLKDE